MQYNPEEIVIVEYDIHHLLNMLEDVDVDTWLL